MIARIVLSSNISFREWNRVEQGAEAQLTLSGHFTQIPSGKADECNGDVTRPVNRGDGADEPSE
jgi:hypothetical protein